ncbi:uncharacterized protein LOC144473179 [Augochlora pura]
MQKRNPADAINKAPSRYRRTMFPSEFALPQDLPKNCRSDRLSVVLSQVDRNFNNENADMKFLYDKYLQSLMMDIILKDKLQEMEKLIITQLATMSEELDLNKQKLFKLKNRERDIIHLTNLQNEIDTQILDIKNTIKSADFKQVIDALSQLHIILQNYDVLHCENIILAKTPKEWEETANALKSCCGTLKSIMDLIESHDRSCQIINTNIKDFLNTYDTIKDYHKRFEKDINELQALVLKTAALSLM